MDFELVKTELVALVGFFWRWFMIRAKKAGSILGPFHLKISDPRSYRRLITGQIPQ